MSPHQHKTDTLDQPTSLFSPILLLTLFFTLVLFGVVNFFAFWGDNADLKKSISEELESHNRIVSNAVLQFFIGKLHTVLLLDRYEPIQNLFKECQSSKDVYENPNYNAVIAMLRSVDKMYQETDREYNAIEHVGSGEIIWLASVPGDFLLTQTLLMGPDFVEDDGTPNPWITKERPWYSYISQTRDIAFTDTYIDVQYHVPCMSIVKTVRDIPREGADDLIGIIGVDIFLPTVNAIMQEAQSGKSGISLLVDGNEIVIYHPNREFSLEGRLRHLGQGYDTIAREIENETDSTSEVVRSFLTNIEGVPSFVTYTRIGIPNVNWYLVSIVPQSDAEQTVTNYFYRFIIVGLANLTLFMVPVGLFLFLEQRKRRAILEINKKLMIAQEAIQLSEIKFRTLFNAAPSGLVLYDPVVDEDGTVTDLRISEVNPALVELIGFPREKLIGQRLSTTFAEIEVISEAFKNLDLVALGQAALSGNSGVYKTFYPPKQTFQRLVIFETGTGQVASFISDDTERVKNELALQTMKSAIDNISEPVIWIDADGGVQYANSAVNESLGYGMDSSLVGEKIWKFDAGMTEAKWLEFIEQIQTERTVRFRTDALRQDGTLFPVYVTINFIEHDEKRIFTACFRDMSEQIRRIEAEQATRAKSRFLNHMSHEMRTPLNGMIGMTDLLIETELTPTQKQYVELAKVSGLQLLSIVKGILDLSELNAGNLHLHQTATFDAAELLNSVVLHTIEKLDEKDSEGKIELSVNYLTAMPRLLRGDEARLEQVILALLDNAIKFTENGTISLTIADEKPDTHLDEPLCLFKFEVTDTGIGISDEKMQQLFESFTIGDASFSRKYGGTGLGLVVSKKIIELMGGTIHVESKAETDHSPGESRFWFIVPLVIDGHTSIPARKWTVPREIVHIDREPIDTMQEESPSDEPLILVVEDNHINQLVVGEILRKAGYNFDIAANGRFACEAVAAKRYSLILMDCQMPIMDGFQATQKIRSMETGMEENKPRHSGHIPIIALTANSLAGDEEQCLQAGMDNFCSKPIEAPRLLEIISGCLETRV